MRKREEREGRREGGEEKKGHPNTHNPIQGTKVMYMYVCMYVLYVQYVRLYV